MGIGLATVANKYELSNVLAKDLLRAAKKSVEERRVSFGLTGRSKSTVPHECAVA